MRDCATLWRRIQANFWRARACLPEKVKFAWQRYLSLQEPFGALRELDAAKKSVESRKVHFRPDRADIALEELNAVEGSAADINMLLSRAQRSGKPVRIEIVGHTDDSGPESRNAELSQERAKETLASLSAAGVPPRSPVHARRGHYRATKQRDRGARSCLQSQRFLSRAAGGAMTPPVQKKICMLGTYAVGKTSLVRKYVESIFDERYLTTIGVKIDKKQVLVNNRQVNLVLWDLAGEDDLAQIRPSHLRGASGYILVADGCREATLAQAIAIQEKSAQHLGPVPFVLAVNKADLATEWQIREADVERLISQGWTCFRTSAKTGESVEPLFLHLAQKMLSEEDEPASE